MLNKYLLVGSILLVVAILFVSMFLWKTFTEKQGYTAVLLKTGDLYFGHLVQFPHFGLRQPYLLQVNRDNPQNPGGLQRFKNAIWGPEDFMTINRDEVVWTANVRADSNLTTLLDTNPDLLSGAPAQTSPASSTETKGQQPSQPKQ